MSVHSFWWKIKYDYSASNNFHSCQQTRQTVLMAVKNHDTATMGFGWVCVGGGCYSGAGSQRHEEWLRVIAVQLLASVCMRVACVGVCLLVSGVRLANTLSSWCGYYAHIQSIWHNHCRHLLGYLSPGILRAQTTLFECVRCVLVCAVYER